MRITFRLIIIFLGILFFAEISHAGTYYVSPTGANSWPNCSSQDNPCRASSSHKEFLGASAGDTVYFLPGTYDPGNAPDWTIPSWNPSNSGTDEKRITFQCLNRGTCTITHNPVGPSIGSVGHSYIIWDGFTSVAVAQMSIARVAGDGTGGANYCTIQNCDFTGFEIASNGTGNNPIIAGNGQAGMCSYLTIRNNKLHGSKPTYNSAAVLFYNVDHATVENNEVHDCTTGFFDKDGGQYNTYRYNYIHDAYFGGLYAAVGIRVGTESGGPNTNHLYIYQNVITSSFAPIWIGGDKPKTYLYVYNNMIYSNNEEAIALVNPGAIDTINVYNNIIYSGLRGFTYKSGMSNLFSDYNNIYNPTWIGRLGYGEYNTLPDWQMATGLDTHSINSNPSLANAGGTSAADYKLNAYNESNPCYHAGKDGITMGAYITGDEVIGYSPPTKNLCIHKSDINCNTCIETNELINFINQWKANQATTQELIEAIVLWKGC